MNPGVANRAGFRVQKNTAIYHDYGGFLANDSNFDRNPVRGCNYGLEGGAFSI